MIIAAIIIATFFLLDTLAIVVRETGMQQLRDRVNSIDSEVDNISTRLNIIQTDVERTYDIVSLSAKPTDLSLPYNFLKH